MSVSKICVVRSVHKGPISNEYTVSGTTFAPEGLIYDGEGMQLEFPAQFQCLLHIAMCSVLCNESTLQYNLDKRSYEKTGESTEVALRVLVEKVRLPGVDSIPSVLNMLSKHERASVPLTTDIRNELGARFHSFAGQDTLRCLALALKRMPTGQQTLCNADEANLMFIGLVGMLNPPREEVRNAILSCMSAGIRIIVVSGDNKSTTESVCQQIGAFEHLDDFTGYSYTASEFEELPPLQRTVALQCMVLFTRVEPSHKKMQVEALQN